MKVRGKSAYKGASAQYHGATAGKVTPGAKVTGASLPESAGKGGERSFPMGGGKK